MTPRRGARRFGLTRAELAWAVRYAAWLRHVRALARAGLL